MACACRKSNPAILVMQSVEDWAAKNTPCPLNSTRLGRVLIQGQVRARPIIVGRVRSQQMAKMPLAEHDNMVQAIASDRTDHPFTISILPRRSRRGRPIPNAHRPKAADEDVTVDGVAVTDDVSRRSFPTIGLDELA